MWSTAGLAALSLVLGGYIFYLTTQPSLAEVKERMGEDLAEFRALTVNWQAKAAGGEMSPADRERFAAELDAYAEIFAAYEAELARAK